VQRTAHAILPIGLPPEIDGTYVNVDGVVQTVVAGAKLPGDARPGWRVLRALGAALGLQAFDFTQFAEINAKVKPALSSLPSGEGARTAGEGPGLAQRFSENRTLTPTPLPEGEGLKQLERIATLPIYRSDAVLRRAPALQSHPLNGECAIGLNPEDALALGLSHGAKAKVSGGDGDVELPVIVTRMVPKGGAWLEKTWSETRPLPPNGGLLTVTRA